MSKAYKGGMFVLSMFLVPGIVFAMNVFEVLDLFIYYITAIVPILISVAIMVFFWGIVKFIAHAYDEKAVAEGKQLIIWGLVGIFVIVALWSIVGYVQSSFGLNLSNRAATVPFVTTTIP